MPDLHNHPKPVPFSQVPLYQTPLDLELDLAAQQSKLSLLQEEIGRLRAIKARLAEAKERGARELPLWLQDHEQFQLMLARYSI